jgi:predicted secreted protein
MSGLFLIVFFVLFVVCIILSHIDNFNDDGWRIGSFVALFFALIWLMAIPISRIDSRTNAEYAKVLQETINQNRKNIEQLNVLERTSIIEEINSCNKTITTWKVKGQKWYNNKWYYDPITQKAEYIK